MSNSTSRRLRLRKVLPYSAFMLPALLTFTVFTIYPLIRTVLYSFTSADGVTHDYHFVGLQNYANALKDEVIVGSIGNTLLYALATTVLINLLSVPLAVLLDNSARSKVLERAIFFFPSVISMLLLGYIWGYILSPTASGAVNSILGLFGANPVPWLSDPALSKVSVLIAAVWCNTGWHTMVNIAYLQAIPPDYYEAAAIDGANRWQRFFHITLPMLAPALTINTLLLLTNGLKVYDLPYAMTNKGGPGYANYTITQTIIQRGISEKQYGLSSAMSTIFIIIVMVIAIVQYTSMSKREEDLG